MKFILYIVVVAVSLWAGWFFHPQISREMAARIAAQKAARAKRDESIRNEAAHEKRTSGEASALLANLNSRQPPPADSANPSANPQNNTSANVASAKPADPPPQAPVDAIEARYPMPNFKTIEQITKEWSAIPSRAFPRKVKTKVPLTFDVAAGKIELPAGADARAAAMVGGMLIVMRENDDTSRVQVPLANTDLKETLTALYEKYKEYRRNLVMKQREHARKLKERSNGASEEQMKLAGPKPEVRAGGVIPIMLESLEIMKLTELKAGNITSWGNLDYEEVDGTVYWTGTVQCTVENALFGPQPTEIMALMKDNKVVKWIYTGSREPVQ